MDIINTVLGWILGLLNSLLPVFNVNPQFWSGLDNAVSTIITIINSAGYFVPLNTLVLCFTVILIFDNFNLLMRVGQWVIKLIRG